MDTKCFITAVLSMALASGCVIHGAPPPPRADDGLRPHRWPSHGPDPYDETLTAAVVIVPIPGFRSGAMRNN